MKFLIVGDLHGQKPKIHFEDFDAIIAPGDFCSDKARKFMFQALRERMKTGKDIKWYDLIGRQKAKAMVKKSLEDGRKILEFLDSFDVPVFVVPGNWDWAKSNDQWDFLKKDHYKGLIKGLPDIIDTYGKNIDAVDYDVVGYGNVSGPEYPQYKEELERIKVSKYKRLKKIYDTNFDRLDKLFKAADNPVIFITHNVPFDTKIDKITDKSSPRYGYHYGSVLARKIIEKHQPLVSIGGHMHEHFGKCKIGKTVCINAGYGSNVNIFMELRDNKIRRLKFYRGR